MAENPPLAWTSIVQAVESAALIPQRRDEMLSRALQEILNLVPAVGTALIWPCHDRKVPWKVQYVGIRRNDMRRWLAARLDPSLDVVIGVLQHDLSCRLSDMPSPIFVRLQTSVSSSPGLWIVWPTPSVHPLTTITDNMERIRYVLVALLEVESKEEDYFPKGSLPLDRELIEALAHGDTLPLPALLSFARVMGKADFVYWGKVHHDTVEVEWQVGARNSGFGFAIPLGHGIGGRVAAHGEPVEVTDYRNSPHRYPGVREIVDKEQVRSGLATPIHDSNAQTTAVLYLTRRTVAPLSLADRLLVQRLARSIEPLTFTSHSVSFFSAAMQQNLDHKSTWSNIILHANRVETYEEWLSQIIKGVAIVADSQGHPYVLAHAERLAQLQASHTSGKEPVQVISLAAPGVRDPGRLYLWPSLSLPPPDWPDFFTDIVVACNTVIARVEQAQDQLIHQWEQWLRALLEHKSLQYIDRDGYRLGLPVEQGQAWVLAWAPAIMQSLKSARMRMIAENVVLDNLKSPLMLLDDIGVVLLKEQASQKPAIVRDELLKYFGPHPIWIVHGAFYHSLPDLKMMLTQAITTARKARREDHEQYISDIYTFGLDSLLENPKLTEDLHNFASRLLFPLLEYDACNGANLTETFVLSRTLGSAQAVAEHLAIHVNTVRYRLHRAEGILGKGQASPKEDTAMMLAAFIWKNSHPADQQ